MTIKNRRIKTLIRHEFIITDRIPASLKYLWFTITLKTGGQEVLVFEKSVKVEFRLFFKTQILMTN